MSNSAMPWWLGSVGYQAYTRSFSDSNGDGIGDLAGIRERLEHLVWLGVDAIWITPFYESPGFDHGYDVSDYLAVNPIHGTMDEFDSLVERTHQLGLRIIVDIVPNHSSSQHRWFKEARKSTKNPYRGYYIWRDPAPDGGPPNNWVSHFGGPAWTFDEASGQYYCHLFLPEQPDFNWENPRVADEFDAILRFWCERGVDGFRVDVAHALTKDQLFRDNPQRWDRVHPDGSAPVCDPRQVFASFDHEHDLHQDATVDIFRRWNKVVAPYGALLIGEVGGHEPERLARYVEDGTALHTLFYLEPVWRGWEPEELLGGIRAVQEATPPDAISWVANNHDSSRSTTRYGGGQRGADRSLAILTLLFGLGGMPFVYQGEELGIGDGTIAESDLQDPITTRNKGAKGRDGCRTAMPWTDGPGNGFTVAPRAWLPAVDRPACETVAGQLNEDGSFINRVRRLIALRRDLSDLRLADVTWLETPSPRIAALRRGSAVIAANWDVDQHTIPLPPGIWSTAFASRDGVVDVAGDVVTIPAETTAILQRG